MSHWAGFPWPASVALALVGTGAMIAALTDKRLAAWALGLIWSSSVFALIFPLVAGNRQLPLAGYLDPYYGVIGWLMGLAVWPCCRAKDRATPSSAPLQERRLGERWKWPTQMWLSLGTALWVAGAYVNNLPGSFYVGLGATIGTLLLFLVWFRLPFWIIQAVFTIMLLCVGLPAADLLLNPPRRVSADPNLLKQYATYTAARKNPAGFEAWWQYFWNQWLDLAAKVLVYEPRAPVPLRLRPNSEGLLVQSHIHINSLGFRGPEIAAEKGNAYRIVALGESTTFGFTIDAEDRPWPELLQQMIRDRLKPARPVEVINAGLPSADLPVNLLRFPTQILPLQPDLIICYHGMNGFHLLDPAIPRTTGKAPPAYRNRPLRLLADCEYRLKLMRYRRASTAGLSSQAPSFHNLMQTEFARAYRDLARICETNHIRLALANFSMAANESSPPELLEFFRPRTPRPYWVVKANAAHTEIVQRIVHEHPGITYVDTHPHLDGAPDKFIDLVHFSHAGEMQMAENVFEGIKSVLARDLGAESPNAAAVQPAVKD